MMFLYCACVAVVGIGLSEPLLFMAGLFGVLLSTL